MNKIPDNETVDDRTAGAQAVTPKPARHTVARVLLADTVLVSRLVLKTVLSAAGYAVSGAATAAEAVRKLDKREYQLVLADLRGESDDAGPRLLAYARQKAFRPATALIASNLSETAGSETAGSETPAPARTGNSPNRTVHISNDDICDLLDRVAALIGQRADRRMRQALLKAT